MRSNRATTDRSLDTVASASAPLARRRPRLARATCLAAVAAVALGVPATAQAQAPAPAPAPALDPLGRPTEPVLGSLEAAAAQPWVPEQLRGAIAQAVGFFRGGDGGGVPIPENGPAIAQFAYPTVMPNCIGGNQNAVGTATAVPGPAQLPLPGVPAGQVGFVFTALGTGKVAPRQSQPIGVEWVNISNGRHGSTPLGFTGVNPDGPATVNGVADTGPGIVLMLLQGGVTTEIDGGRTSECAAMPTVGTVTVR